MEKRERERADGLALCSLSLSSVVACFTCMWLSHETAKFSSFSSNSSVICAMFTTFYCANFWKIRRNLTPSLLLYLYGRSLCMCFQILKINRPQWSISWRRRSFSWRRVCRVVRIPYIVSKQFTAVENYLTAAPNRNGLCLFLSCWDYLWRFNKATFFIFFLRVKDYFPSTF